SVAPSLPAPRGSWSRALPWALATAVLTIVALAIPAVRHLRETPPIPDRLVTLTMYVAPADRLGPTSYYGRPTRTAFAVSPDGTAVVFVGEAGATTGNRTRMLYRRPLAEAHAVAIPGTERAELPFFSTDGQWVGFAAGNTLKKVALGGGPPIDLCNFPSDGRVEGAHWGSAGLIVFARAGLWTVPESGGKPQALLDEAPNAFRGSPIML